MSPPTPFFPAKATTVFAAGSASQLTSGLPAHVINNLINKLAAETFYFVLANIVNGQQHCIISWHLWR
jgi:hypothetical protein